MVVAIKDKFCGITEAAETIGCTTSRVRQLLIAGEIVGEKIDSAANAPWLVDRASVLKYAKNKPPTGRPRISDSSKAS